MSKKRIQMFVDLGNSQTRVFARGHQGDGKTIVSQGFVLDNRFAAVRKKSDLDSFLESDYYNQENSTLLRVDLGDKIKNLKGIFTAGEIALKEYQTKLVNPTRMGAKPKAENYIVYLALIQAVDKVYEWLLNSYGDGFTKTKLAKKVHIDLTLLVPPVQKSSAQKMFDEVLVNNLFTYYDYFTDEEIPVEISRVSVMEEGLAAYFGVTVSLSEMQLRASHADLNEKRVLILDIGAGTTDFLATDKGRLLERVKQTVQIGGNRILQRTRGQVNYSLDTTLSEDAFQHIMEDPTVQVGSRTVDVTEELENAIYEVTDDIVGELVSYFETIDVDLASFQRLMIIGGGAMSNNLDVSIADEILNGVSSHVPDIELVDLSDLEEPSVKGVDLDLVSLRNLNLLGAVTRGVLEEMLQSSSE